MSIATWLSLILLTTVTDVGGGSEKSFTGKQLAEGLQVELRAGKEKILRIR